jgi:pimeloyl-ACP methyl ester carboxylesterase
VVFKQVRDWLAKTNRTKPLVVMGRSLGSASAVELAASYQEEVAGLIIESGFARTVPLLVCLGVNTAVLGLTEADGFKNVEKMKQITKPTLIVHARHDQIIPVTEAESLQVHCAARSKEFSMIPGADHNSIMVRTGAAYFEMIKCFTNKIEGKRVKCSFREKRERRQGKP